MDTYLKYLSFLTANTKLNESVVMQFPEDENIEEFLKYLDYVEDKNSNAGDIGIFKQRKAESYPNDSVLVDFDTSTMLITCGKINL